MARTSSLGRTTTATKEGRTPMAGISLRRAWASLVAATLMLALLTAAPVAAASPTACRVKNLDTGVTKARLQTAVWSARAGDRLTVKGTCRGTTIINKDLTISGVRTAASGKPILDGARTRRVIAIRPKVTVKMRSLTVRRGVAQTGGGILNEGTLILRDTVVRASSAAYGGGVYNFGTLRLNGSSSIRANRTVNPGGVSTGDTATLSDVSSTSNPPIGACVGGRAGTPDVSGGGVLNGGTMVLNGSSSISGNRTDIWGGGVYNSGTLILNRSSAIRGNTAGATGGGVYNDVLSTLKMNGSSSISGNTASGYDGGGICNLGTLSSGVVCAGNVHDNSPDDCAP